MASYNRDEYEAELEDDLLGQMDEDMAAVDQAELLQAVEENYVEAADRALFRDDLVALLAALLSSHLFDAFRAAGQAQADIVGIEFDPMASAYTSSISAQATAAAINVRSQANATVRNVIIRAQRSGLPPAQIAIQVALFMFLTDRAAAALQLQWSKMLANGMKLAVIVATIKTAARRALLDRVDLIASTEITDSIGAASLLIWSEADRRGLIQGAMKRWVTAFDEMVCPTCKPLHGVTVPLYSTFPGGFDAPPAHPRCRCHPELIR